MDENVVWVEDSNGNRCYVEYFGSKEKAQEALDSLTNCENCINCSRCFGCSGCYDCSRCYRCSYCSRCYDCYGCYECSRCSGYSDCSEKDALREHNEKPSVVPVIKNLHKKVYAAASNKDSLNMDRWHSCDTTHCRGGWVVHLAGKDGKRLEDRFGTLLAAMMIYDASCQDYKINPCRFFDTNEEALADMKKLAEQKEREEWEVIANNALQSLEVDDGEFGYCDVCSKPLEDKEYPTVHEGGNSYVVVCSQECKEDRERGDA